MVTAHRSPSLLRQHLDDMRENTSVRTTRRAARCRCSTPRAGRSGKGAVGLFHDDVEGWAGLAVEWRLRERDRVAAGAVAAEWAQPGHDAIRIHLVVVALRGGPEGHRAAIDVSLDGD